MRGRWYLAEQVCPRSRCFLLKLQQQKLNFCPSFFHSSSRSIRFIRGCMRITLFRFTNYKSKKSKKNQLMHCLNWTSHGIRKPLVADVINNSESKWLLYLWYIGTSFKSNCYTIASDCSDIVIYLKTIIIFAKHNWFLNNQFVVMINDSCVRLAYFLLQIYKKKGEATTMWS